MFSDENSKFFYGVVNTNKRKNHIIRLNIEEFVLMNRKNYKKLNIFLPFTSTCIPIHVKY